MSDSRLSYGGHECVLRVGIFCFSASRTKRTVVDATENVTSEVVFLQICDEALGTGIFGYHEHSEHRLDLPKALFDSVDIALWRTAFVARACEEVVQLRLRLSVSIT